jgi:hypothetical protein
MHITFRLDAGMSSGSAGSKRLTSHSVSGLHTGVWEQRQDGHTVNTIHPSVRLVLSSILGGEIDIFQGINLQPTNVMSLHTSPGCTMPDGITQTGTPQGVDCDTSSGHNQGCSVVDAGTNSYGQAFSDAGGGIWVTQFDTNGIKMWFVTVSSGHSHSIFACLTRIRGQEWLQSDSVAIVSTLPNSGRRRPFSLRRPATPTPSSQGNSSFSTSPFAVTGG